MARYSQWKAFRALTLASLRSLIKSPSSVVFTLAFPLVFVLGFGFLGGENNTLLTLGIPDNTNAAIYNKISQDPLVKPLPMREAYLDSFLTHEIIDVALFPDSLSHCQLICSSNPDNKLHLAQVLLQHYLQEGGQENIQVKELPVFTRNKIDFVLTGQLGFSLLAASIFGVAFVFFGLRQELVLKRFFATPIKRWNILLSEATARMIFQLVGALILILLGHYFFHFTLVEGTWTVFKLLFLSAIGVLVFMSFGFIISGLAKSNAAVPPLANIIVLPQFILAGTLFPIYSFPKWLQWIANILPLTHLNEAFRKIALEGASFWQIKFELLILLVWGVIAYAFAAFLFKWE